MNTLDDLTTLRRDEIEHFFAIYKELEPGKATEVMGWDDADGAARAVSEAAAVFAERQSG